MKFIYYAYITSPNKLALSLSHSHTHTLYDPAAQKKGPYVYYHQGISEGIISHVDR